MFKFEISTSEAVDTSFGDFGEDKGAIRGPIFSMSVIVRRKSKI